MNLGYSPYKNLKTLKWCPMDTEELYKLNLSDPKKRILLHRYGWINSEFTYNFNSNGFRCDEFADLPSAVFLGCSITMGIGLPLEKTWSHLVSQNLNLTCYNLGIGGSSNDTAFRIAHAWLKKIKPKLLVFCQTFSHRYEIFDGHSFVFKQEIIDDKNKLHNYYTLHNKNCFLNQEKNKLAIHSLCNSLGIKFISTEVEKLKKLDLARDLCHPGVESNKKFADYVLTLV